MGIRIKQEMVKMRKQFVTVCITMILTFVVVHNAALTTISVKQQPDGYAVELFGAVAKVK